VSYNRVTLMGNLTRDPERKAAGETSVVSFGLALNEKYKDQERTTFVDVTMFGARADAFARFHSKGDRVLIEGKLRLDTWEKDGQKRSKLYVVADSFEFAKENRSGGGASSPSSPPPAAGDPWAAVESSTPF
jgi:single-strand DNA-binding protein